MLVPRIVLVEDDLHFRETLADYLALRGFEVSVAGNSAELKAALAGKAPDAVVVDLNLGRESGFDIVASLRIRWPAMNIIMLTARDGVDDYVAGLRAGADVYLSKPIDLRALEASILSMMRRTTRLEPPPRVNSHWTLSRIHWTLTAPNGNCVQLTAAEFRFLRLLAGTPGQPVEHGTLLAMHGNGNVRDHERRLVTLVNRLRRKVEAEAGVCLPVKAARAAGYGFVAPISADA